MRCLEKRSVLLVLRPCKWMCSKRSARLATQVRKTRISGRNARVFQTVQATQKRHLLPTETVQLSAMRAATQPEMAVEISEPGAASDAAMRKWNLCPNAQTRQHLVRTAKKTATPDRQDALTKGKKDMANRKVSGQQREQALKGQNPRTEPGWKRPGKYQQ